MGLPKQGLPQRWNGPSHPQPTEPGVYLAMDVVIDMLGSKINSRPYNVKVVEGIKNQRNQRLLVETGGKNPRYKSLDCYDWLLK